jgi:Uma2 family endonuclease
VSGRSRTKPNALAEPGPKPDIAGVLAVQSKRRPPSGRLSNRLWAFDELATELPESVLPTELWDGELIKSPAPSFQHQEVVLRFYRLLDAWATRKQAGKTIAAPVDMVLSPRRAVQPDVLFIARERLGIVQQCVRGPADLVAEVLSPASRRRDRIEKRDLYEQHGVREYWMLDPEAGTIEVLALESGEYRLAGRWREGETARSQLLEGFAARVDSVFLGS